MAIQAYTDMGSIVIVLVMMTIINTFAYFRRNGTFAIMAGMLGLFTLGWVVKNGQIVQSAVYNPNTSSWVYDYVDPNLITVVVAVYTIFSMLFIYFERFQ